LNLTSKVETQWNILVVIYGSGDLHEVHTIDEKVSIEEYLRGIEIFKKILQYLKRLHDKKCNNSDTIIVLVCSQ